MANAIINGRVFSHVDIFFNVLDLPITSLSKIKYDNSRDAGFTYGTSKYPVGYSTGKTKPVDGSFEINLKEFNILNKAAIVAGLDSVLDSPIFDITVKYVNGSDTFTDTLIGTLITKIGHASEDGNDDLKIEIDFTASRIKTTY